MINIVNASNYKLDLRFSTNKSTYNENEEVILNIYWINTDTIPFYLANETFRSFIRYKDGNNLLLSTKGFEKKYAPFPPWRTPSSYTKINPGDSIAYRHSSYLIYPSDSILLVSNYEMNYLKNNKYNIELEYFIPQIFYDNVGTDYLPRKKINIDGWYGTIKSNSVQIEIIKNEVFKNYNDYTFISSIDFNTPLFTIEDIVFYDWGNHIITLTDSGIERYNTLRKELKPKQFYVCLNGDKVYSGYFWIQIMSYSPSGPIIWDRFLDSNSKLNDNQIQIDMGYQGYRKPTKDTRENESIYNYLKLKDKLR